MTTIENNLQTVRERMARACAAAGRDPAGVSLLAVSKTFGPDAVREAARAGQTAFGENYIQEAVEKMAVLDEGPDPLRPRPQWHCIGPIQSNKTRLVAEHFDWAHTVDRLKVAQRLSQQRPAHLPPLQVCIQVNVDGGANKSGVTPDEAPALALAVAGLPGLVLRGLMCIPEPVEGFEAQLKVCAQARALFDEVRRCGLPQPEIFDTLSMGMSADLEAAIAAGSTMVRVGTAIFGGRSYGAPCTPA